MYARRITIYRSRVEPGIVARSLSVTEDGGKAGARAITAESVRGSRVTRSMRLVVNLKQRNYNI